MSEKNKKIPSAVIIALLCVITAISVTTAVVTLRKSKEKTILAPDYAVSEAEPSAEPIPNEENTEKLPAEEGGGSVSLTFSDSVAVSLSEKKVSLYFANPSRSTNDMLLQLIIKDNLIAQSGMLKPGYEVTEISMESGAEALLTEGIYEGELLVSFYDPENSEKAMVNTSIPMKITVNS